MVYQVARSLRFLAKALTAESAPRRVAMGFAMGIAIGIMPKGNLTAITLICMLFAMRLNIAAALVSASIFTLLSPIADPIFHSVGRHLLTLSGMQGIYANWWQMPLIPWTQLNNTVVLGALVVGILQLFPMARIMTPYFERRLPMWSDMSRNFTIGRALLGEKESRDREITVTEWRAAA
ncbi:MAG: TIGR03546 family protein [Planctomycetota bacterium]